MWQHIYTFRSLKSNINLVINLLFHLKLKEDLFPINDLFRTITRFERERERYLFGLGWQLAAQAIAVWKSSMEGFCEHNWI
jgi:hypothetical protein